jgi:3-phenylpropionate/trans-cinnamate dioxygenase ferredoxin reductase subunit
VLPDVTLARAAGLELGEAGGVRCSASLESSVPGVYAAGDICEFESPILGRPLRVEHWDVALNQGKTAALAMLGQDVVHDVVPYFFSDLADWVSLEYVGAGAGELALRGSFEQGEFTGFYLDDGRVTAAISIGRSDDLEHARRFIAAGGSPDPAALADLDTDLAAL